MYYDIQETVENRYRVIGMENIPDYRRVLEEVYDNDIWLMEEKENIHVEFVEVFEYLDLFRNEAVLVEGTDKLDEMYKQQYFDKCLETILSNKQASRKVFDTIFDEIDPEEYVDKIELNKYVSFSDALDIVESHDGWWEHTNTEVIDISSVAGLVTFDNAHLLSHMLATHNPDIAKALYEELRYWAEAGRF